MARLTLETEVRNEVRKGAMRRLRAGGALPAMDRVKSLEPLVRSAEEWSGPDTRWALAGLPPGAFCLALDRHDLAVFRDDDLVARSLEMMREQPGTILFTRPRYQARLAEALAASGEGARLLPLAVRQVGGKHLIALRRQGP